MSEIINMESLIGFPLKLFVCFMLFLTTHCEPHEGETWDYCSDEYFNPTCSSGDIVYMQSARYGHIKLGRCVDADLGSLGCFVDQLSVMDRLCSGKQTCNIHFGDSDMEGEFPCALKKVFVRYLEASFVCLKVYQAQHDCKRQTQITASSRMKYLSSELTAKHGCGEEDRPWILQAREGQRINITLSDFMWKYNTKEESPERCPVQYGNILDVTNNDVVHLCGGLVRSRSIYFSAGSNVQVIIDRAATQNARFLIGYKAVGCPVFTAPPNTWTKEEEDHITVGCVNGKETWRMRCIGTNWLGPQRECLKFEDNQGHVQAAPSAQQDSQFLGMSPVVASALFGGLAVVIASVIITVGVGLFCIRKPKKKSEAGFNSTIPQLIPVDDFPTYKSVQIKVPKQRADDTMLKCVGSDRTMSSVGSIPRYPAPHKDSPHYYLLEGRDMNDTEPLYDVVYQGSPSENIA